METAKSADKKNHRIVRENGFQAAYRDALHRARESLRNRDMASCCASAGAVLTQTDEDTGTIELTFLNRPVSIAFPTLSFNTDANEETVSTWEQVLVLHYLANSEQATLTDTLINYRRLRDGALYAEAFERRCIQPLLASFGLAPDDLIPAAHALGGVAAEYGDSAVRIPAFPRLDIICSLWKSDDEFGPEATILFDAGAEHFLCAEDIAVLCQQIVLKLIKTRIA